MRYMARNALKCSLSFHFEVLPFGSYENPQTPGQRAHVLAGRLRNLKQEDFVMKLKIVSLLCAGMILLSGCASNAQKQQIAADQFTETKPDAAAGQPAQTTTIEPESTADQPAEPESDPTAETNVQDEQSAEPNDASLTEEIRTGESSTDDRHLDDTAYVGEYLDSDVEEPNLEIARGDDGNYIVQIGIYRLTSLDDGIGELTDDGMNFTATDSAGNPISGVITVEGQTATVTFTDSTWGYLQNGDTFRYTKSSDIPNIWPNFWGN